MKKPELIKICEAILKQHYVTRPFFLLWRWDLWDLWDLGSKQWLSVVVKTDTHTAHTASLILHHPLLLFSPLSPDILESAREARKAGLDSKWLTKTLFYNLVGCTCTLCLSLTYPCTLSLSLSLSVALPSC